MEVKQSKAFYLKIYANFVSFFIASIFTIFFKVPRDQESIPTSSSVDINNLSDTVTSSQSVNNPGLKTLVLNSELNSETNIIQGLQVKLNLDHGKFTKQYESKINELTGRIQEREDLIKDLTEKLADLTSDNSRKESKIIEQSAILAKKRNHIQFLENQISKNLETSDVTKKAFKQEKDSLKASLRQSKLQASELRTDVQKKVNFIHNLETKVAELTNEVVTKVKANTQLELERNSLEKKFLSLEAKISDLESQSIVKDQMYRQLVTEKQDRMKQLVTTADKIKSTEYVMDLDVVEDEKSVEFDESFQLYLSEVRNVQILGYAFIDVHTVQYIQCFI